MLPSVDRLGVGIVYVYFLTIKNYESWKVLDLECMRVKYMAAALGIQSVSV